LATTLRPVENPSPKRDLHYEGWLTLRTPLLHGDSETLGNCRLFRSLKTVCEDGRVRRIPVYSGNAFRGKLRDLAAYQLMEALQVQLPPPVFHFLTSGGALTAGGGQAIDVDRARALRKQIPMVGVFGGGVGSQILEGKLKVLPMTPICRETVHLLPSYCRQAPSAGLSIRDLRQMDFGTRRDDSKRESAQPYLEGGQEAAAKRSDDEVSTSMIYENEVLIQGTCLRFGFVLEGATDREWLCLGRALAGWLADPYLGGRSSAGYGEVAAPSLFRSRRNLTFHQDAGEGALIDLTRPLASVESEVDLEDRLEIAASGLDAAYRADVQAHREELIQGLRSVV